MSTDTISEITRRDIFDVIRSGQIKWAGRPSETEFLERLYHLSDLPSFDTRFTDLAGDLWQHRVNNHDWDDDWVLTDPRLGLESGPDEVFLAFVSEMFHPAVRPYDDEARRVLETLNGHLAPDGWEIAERSQISGRPVFAARRLLSGTPAALDHAQALANTLNAEHVDQQITRMKSAVENDPELAIGTAKEFLETICKTVLDAVGGMYGNDDDLPRLVKLTLKELRLAADDVPGDAAVSNIVRRVLGGLSSVAQGVAELRNRHGTGHGKSAWHESAEPRHARLAVGAASALGVFLFESYQEWAAESEGRRDNRANS